MTGAAALELKLATTAANPKVQNKAQVQAAYYNLTQVNYTSVSGLVDVDLPAYASTIPWLEDGEEQQTLYIILKTVIVVVRGSGITH